MYIHLLHIQYTTYASHIHILYVYTYNAHMIYLAYTYILSKYIYCIFNTQFLPRIYIHFRYTHVLHIKYTAYPNMQYVAKCHRLRSGCRRPTGCRIFIGHFPQKTPTIIGTFAKNDLQLKASYGSSPPCIKYTVYPIPHIHWIPAHKCICHFPHKSHIISGSFAKNDVHLNYSSPTWIKYTVYPRPHIHWIPAH